ncbi:hypothetical protein EON66_04635 [archaeon]|nr:MAG: hypothetical protein EON66_04635 [archaeon]
MDIESLDAASLAAKVCVCVYPPPRAPFPLPPSAVGARCFSALRGCVHVHLCIPLCGGRTVLQLEEVNRSNELLNKENAVLQSYLQRHVSVRRARATRTQSKPYLHIHVRT